ncbi:MAG: ABC transporter permease [Clostridia bacterium]|nr:ABC transporter permease [Clostridia bacterium]
MSLKKSFILALSNIMYDKMRSLLTMLGIIIGVAAVIILISLMNGMTNMMTEKFSEMGLTTITVNIRNRGGSRTVDEDIIWKLRDENTTLIDGVSPSSSLSSATVKVGSNSITDTATGVSEEYADMKQLEIQSGRFFQYAEVAQHKKVCVIGTYIQQELFGFDSALNQDIKINGDSYRVVGVLKEEDDSESGGSDDIIYIPYTTAMRASGTTTISSYTITATSEDTVDAAVTLLKNTFLAQLGDSDYYTVTDMKSLMDTATEMMDTMEILLVCIAGISLLVGGIGIMNIMLVSVTERTREIGIRKSLGAKGRDIMAQFVIEAGTVSGMGGVLGIVLGAVLAIVVGNLLGLTATPSVGAVALSFGVSVGIGILFGYLPAKNAARLNPIDALRHD